MAKNQSKSQQLEAKKSTVEAELSKIAARVQKKRTLIVKLGSKKYMFDGGFREFADFLDKSSFKELKPLNQTEGEWSSWEDRYKPMNSSYRDNKEYISDSQLDIVSDISLDDIELLSVEDAEKWTTLRKQYKSIQDEINAEAGTKESDEVEAAF